MKMEVPCFSETSVSSYKTIQCPNLKELVCVVPLSTYGRVQNSFLRWWHPKGWFCYIPDDRKDEGCWRNLQFYIT
jgi:hypothetical protein